MMDSSSNTVNEFDHQILQRHAFGIADASMCEALPDGIPESAAALPLVPPELAANAHLLPRLIDLRALSPQQSDALLHGLYQAQQAGTPPPLAMLVASSLGAPEFARYWNSMQLAAPEPGRRVWLRLHDPRVLHQLLRILTLPQWRTLFGHNDSFTYWVGGEWVRASAAAVPGAVSASAAVSRWDWRRIELIGAINRALHGAGVQYAAALASQGGMAEHLIERAKQHHGLEHLGDVVEFAVRGLTTHAAFDEHPAVAAAIRPDPDPAENSSLADRLALIDEQIWAALRQPANMRHQS